MNQTAVATPLPGPVTPAAGNTFESHALKVRLDAATKDLREAKAHVNKLQAGLETEEAKFEASSIAAKNIRDDVAAWMKAVSNAVEKMFPKGSELEGWGTRSAKYESSLDGWSAELAAKPEPVERPENALYASYRNLRAVIAKVNEAVDTAHKYEEACEKHRGIASAATVNAKMAAKENGLAVIRSLKNGVLRRAESDVARALDAHKQASADAVATAQAQVDMLKRNLKSAREHEKSAAQAHGDADLSHKEALRAERESDISRREAAARQRAQEAGVDTKGRAAKPWGWMRHILPEDGTAGAKLGSYRVERLLGAGSQAKAYLAANGVRQAALKIIDKGNVRPEVWNGIKKEARSLAEIDHPNVVTLFDFVETELQGDDLAYEPWTLVYMVLRYMCDGNLDDLRKKSKGEVLDAATAMDACAAAGRGLAAIHAAGLLHRDVKPQNILVDRGQYRIADLGIAMEADSEQTSLTGTLGYLAPEILAANHRRDASLPYSRSSDVYGLGSTAFFLLTGKTVAEAIARTRFQDETGKKKLWEVFEGAQLPDPREYCKDISKRVAKAVMKCAALDPSKRYQSAQEAADAFHEAIHKKGLFS